MNSPHPAPEAWAEWWRKLDSLKAALARGKSTLVSSTKLREQAKDTVQFYFRVMRPQLVALSVDEGHIATLDHASQHLLMLASHPNRKSTYLMRMFELNSIRGTVEAAIEIRAGSGLTHQVATRLTTTTESAILTTLDQVVPTTALSYRQVLQDLGDQQRVSFRGTAAELREVLRELLDHLAPDADVLEAGAKLAKDQKRPSMKQKVVFILKARGIGETARNTAADSVGAVEGAIGDLARSVYDRGSLSTHVATTRREVMTFKGYADAVLAELLKIHK